MSKYKKLKPLIIEKCRLFWEEESLKDYINNEADPTAVNLEDEFYLAWGEFNFAEISTRDFNKLLLNCLSELGYNVPHSVEADELPKLDDVELNAYIETHYDSLREDVNSEGNAIFDQFPDDTKEALISYYGVDES